RENASEIMPSALVRSRFLLPLHPRSQGPPWEREAPKFCFVRSARQENPPLAVDGSRSGASGRCVPKEDLGNEASAKPQAGTRGPAESEPQLQSPLESLGPPVRAVEREGRAGGADQHRGRNQVRVDGPVDLITGADDVGPVEEGVAS